MPDSVDNNSNKDIDVSIIKNVDKQLVSNLSSSIQPNILLRTAIFTPVGRRTSKANVSNDLSNDLRELDLCQKEGYDEVRISGARLNIETDFRCWCGIILSFTKYGMKDSNKISLKFSEFATLCGYKTKRFDAALRKQLADSLGRIRSQNLSFKKKEQVSGVHTGLLYRAEYDEKVDLIELVADESLWDLYALDHQAIVSMKVIEKLPRAEVAQCLYLFFLSLPQNPYPVSYKRMRERLQLTSEVKEANRRIKAAIDKLESIGYLVGDTVKKDGETYYCIVERRKTLKLPK